MDFEKLGAFYLGKHYDLESDQLSDTLTMYDARDLTTHAVCVGMTGSGKTGLCIDLLEEAAIDHVPALIIDPKGDLTNLLLTFPNLRPEDFRPWINPDDARRKGVSEDAYAAQQADLWRRGLAEWGQDGERIRMLRESADIVIYTPGSDAGIPVSILSSFAAPTLDWASEAEVLRERIQGTVSALLGLVGIDADPVRSREHILLSNLFEHYWRQGEDLDLPKIIMAIQKPPMKTLGVFDVDTFFPERDRFQLAMSLNAIIAAPAFQSWLSGQPMDIAGFLSTPKGKTRHSIFYIAHLSEPERIFFVTILLNQLITWMRAQPGTTSLRAMLYMDEVFGFFPPTANPPTKKPLLTLLKQARAFGVGVVLTTQNPADLDYKGLTNAGTWFIGRLQAERDKLRLLDGLESASSEAGAVLDRQTLNRIMSSLGRRVFLLHNVHNPAPLTFQTRWAMSYLRGPLTRTQVRDLMRDHAPDPVAAPTRAAGQTVAALTPGPASTLSESRPAEHSPYTAAPPVLPSNVQQVYLPQRKGAATAESELSRHTGGGLDVEARQLVYSPKLLGIGRVHFVRQTQAVQVNAHRAFGLLLEPPRGLEMPRWEEAQELDLEPRDLLGRPEPGARFDSVPETLNDARKLSALQKDLEEYLYRSYTLELFYSPAVKLYSEPDEDERAFHMRVSQAAREMRDAEVDRLQERYAGRIRTAEERMRNARVALERREADARARKQDALLTAGETVLSLFSGRRRSIAVAARKATRISSSKTEIQAASERIDVLQADMEKLQQALKDETDAIVRRWESALERFETISVKPRRTDISVSVFSIAWAPHWHISYRHGGVLSSAMIPAY